jgi:hypothetical protein
MTMDAILCESIFDICLLAVEQVTGPDFASAFARIAECCHVVVRRHNDVDREQLQLFRKLSMKAIEACHDSGCCLWVIEFMKDLQKLGLNPKNPKLLFRILNFTSRDSNHQTLVSLIEFVTMTVPIFPQIVGQLKDVGFVAIVLQFLVNGCATEKLVAAKFFVLLADPLFFQDEREAFAEWGIVQHLGELLLGHATDAEKLRLAAGILNVLWFLRKTGPTGNDPLAQAFYDPALLELLGQADRAENTELGRMLGMMLSCLREFDEEYPIAWNQ